jgi:hypothetical protein
MLRDDKELQALFNPLLQAIGNQQKDEFWRIMEAESEGVLAWGVRSGYLLWTRTHPGVIPTKEQIANWMKQGKTS